jgi:hypothetical protein
LREAVRVVLYPRYLRRTLAIAVTVGTVLFAINQLDVVVRGDATTVVWLKSALTDLVPFCVSNAGVLVATDVGQTLQQDRTRADSSSSRLQTDCSLLGPASRPREAGSSRTADTGS